MSLDFPASGNAFWAIYDATGIRPEWLIPVLAYESGLNPAIPNSSGTPYYGIGQNSVADISAYGGGVDPTTYMTWSASQQLSTVVKGYFSRVVSKYGPLSSGIRVYQAEYLPATIPTATSLSDVISSAPSAYYEQNRSFDPQGKGYITVGDLGNAVSSQLSKAYVQDAISQTYALRPWEFETDPVYGSDFAFGGLGGFLPPLALAASFLLLSALAANAINPGSVPLPKLLKA